MRYPEFIKKKSTIGFVAPSCGVTASPYKERLDSAINTFTKLGHKIVLSESVRKSYYYGFDSADAKQRAKEFMDMYLDDNIDAIISVAGGEFMVEILPYIDFNKLRDAKPKWFQGMSDNTNLVLTLTTLCDIASIYGDCAGHFGMQPWHNVLKNQYKFLLGKNNPVESENKIEIDNIRKEKGHELDIYDCKYKTNWSILSGEKEVKFQGRLVGGCMDIIELILGTKYDQMKRFTEKYKEDGIIWFVESCDLNILDQDRFFWKMKEMGMFKYAKGIIIGRPLIKENARELDYKTANFHNLKDLGIPVIIDCDFGHVHPCFHIVSGAIGKVYCKNGKGKIEYILK